MHELATKPGISLTRDFDNVTDEQFLVYEEFVDSLNINDEHPLRKFVNDYMAYF
jgi:hypothetical protein